MTLDTAHIRSHMYLLASFLVVVHKDSMPMLHALLRPMVTSTGEKVKVCAAQSLYLHA